jgi:hypothetical protein
MRKLGEYAWATGERLQVGGWFLVKHRGHFAHGQIHQAWRIQQEKVAGNPDMPDLELGVMVEFIIEDYYGQPCHHAIPIGWVQVAQRPSIARRVKGARFPQDNTADPAAAGDLLPHS